MEGEGEGADGSDTEGEGADDDDPWLIGRSKVCPVKSSDDCAATSSGHSAGSGSESYSDWYSEEGEEDRVG